MWRRKKFDYLLMFMFELGKYCKTDFLLQSNEGRACWWLESFLLKRFYCNFITDSSVKYFFTHFK